MNLHQGCNYRGPSVLMNLLAIKTIILSQEKSDHLCSDVVSWPHLKTLLPTNIYTVSHAERSNNQYAQNEVQILLLFFVSS